MAPLPGRPVELMLFYTGADKQLLGGREERVGGVRLYRLRKNSRAASKFQKFNIPEPRHLALTISSRIW
jgi:hypothetical protein